LPDFNETPGSVGAIWFSKGFYPSLGAGLMHYLCSWQLVQWVNTCLNTGGRF